VQHASPSMKALEERLLRLEAELAECRRAAAVSAASHERMKLMTDNAPVLLAYCDAQHRYKYVNAAYGVRFELNPDELVGQSVATVLGEQVWARIRPHREKVLTGEPVEYEVDVHRGARDAERMRCALNPERDSSGRVVGYVAAIIDVTDRRRIAEARDLLAAIVQSSDDAIFSNTLAGRITSWNAGAARLFGYAEEEMIGQPITTIMAPDLHDDEERILQRLGRGERIDHYETVRVAKEGRRLNIWLTASPVRDHTGEIIGVSTVARDITEQKRSEAALKTSEEALREADRRKDEFLAVLAHELRNPLAPLVNGLELIRHAGAGDDALQRTSDMMERQLTQLVRLVDDLLDISRITRGRFELRRAPVSLILAVENAVESCHALIASRGHEVALDLETEPLLVDGDFARLSQIFANLVSNSVKYTDRGGRIRVSVARRGAEAVVTIQDTGIGIPRESLATVFDMFAQIRSHQPRAEGGLGIGLALVRSLVQMHGGSVAVDSDGPGKGSTFTVRLPLLGVAQTRDAPVRGAGSSDVAANRKRRILVADDNADAAASLAMLLLMQGHETRTAADGRQAVELAATFQPDIIFMDVGMPRVDGLEATRQIRTQPWGKTMLIVALTGWGQKSDRHQTQQAGMDLHLVKPINLEGIAAVLAHA
jgi:PAS domain S-box-containing protein